MRPVLIACIALSLWGCGRSASDSHAEQKIDLAKAQAAAEEKLLSDPDKAASELIKRLNASVKMRDGFLTLQGDSYWLDGIPAGIDNLSVLSPNSSWVVQCGFLGVTVIFGHSVSVQTSDDPGNSESNVDNEMEIRLSEVSPTTAVCEKISPLIAKRLQAIVADAH